MKAGRTLAELAAELDRQTKTRKDYIAPQGKLEAVVETTGLVKVRGLNGDEFGVTNHAHRQVAEVLGIPQRYYDVMKAEQPDLLATNINTWFKAASTERRMVRTLDGRIRAFMSPKYRPLDNYELAEAVLPKLIELKAEIQSCELTETRMYLKAILPTLSDTLPDGLAWGVGHNRVAGGKICAAIVIANSEVGAGTLRVEPSVFTSGCTNLLILVAAALKKYHIGRAFDAQEDFSIYRDETRKTDDQAFFMKVQDVLARAFDAEAFKAAADSIRKAAETPIAKDTTKLPDLPAVVEQTVKVLALPDRTTSGILTHLAAGGDFSLWGLSSAITRTANDAEDYEEATELERAGGRVLALPTRDWDAILTASAAA